MKIISLTPGKINNVVEFLSAYEKVHPEIASAERLTWQNANGYIAIEDNEICGFISQLPHKFFYGRLSGRYDDTEPIGWGIGLVLTDKNLDLRKQAGRALLSKCENSPPLKYAAVGVVPEIEGPYKRRGHNISREGSCMYGRFLEPEKALKYLGKKSWYSPLIYMANAFTYPKENREYTFIEIERFDPEWDWIWKRYSDETYRFYGERTAEFLNHKLSQPGKKHTALLYYSHHYSKKPDGYVIYRYSNHPTKDMKLLRICDYGGSPKAKLSLFREIVLNKWFDHEDIYGIVGLGGIQDEKIFRQAGLWMSKPYPVVTASDITEKTHVTFFDSDLDDMW